MQKFSRKLLKTMYRDDLDCNGLSEEACEKFPKNYVLNAFNGFCTKLSEQLASPELVLPWVFSLLGVPPFVSGLLIPVKNVGSLIPQLIVSAKIREYRIRKYFWSGAALVQGFMLLIIALAVIYTKELWAGLIIVAALLFFSIASGVASISYKDTMAKTIPKGRRGRLLALRATGGGVLTIVVGMLFYFFISESEEITTFSWIFVSSATLWFLAAFIFYGIDELAGQTAAKRKVLREFREGVKILKSDNDFRRFIMARGLLLAIPLVQPYLLLYAQEQIGISIKGLGLFVIITGFSNAVSSPFWGKFADWSSRKLMITSALMASLVCIYVMIFDYFPNPGIYLYSPVFLLVIFAYGGARMGRKTYLVDYAPKDNRPLYISVANTSIGILILLSGALGFISSLYGLLPMISTLLGMMLLAAWQATRLKEV